MTWIRKYAPKSLKEYVNQKDAVAKFLAWIKNWKPGKKPLLFYGPPGVGKTALVYAYAHENNLAVIELNASDTRNYSTIRKVIGSSMKGATLFKKGKIFLIDEIDGLAPRYDAGAVNELLKIVKESRYPIVFIANDPYSPKLRHLRENCELVVFKRLSVYDVERRLKQILDAEGIKADKQVLRAIANRNTGDLRGAINDLEVVARGKKEITVKDLDVLGYREREENIFNTLKIIFKTKSPIAAKLSIMNIDKDPDEVFWWIEENVLNEYEKLEEIAKAYDALSIADIFRRRIMRRQNWRLMVYYTDMMTIGVALAKKEMYRKFTRYKPPSVLRTLGMLKYTREKEKQELKDLAEYLHCSTKKVKTEFLPFLKLIYKDRFKDK